MSGNPKRPNDEKPKGSMEAGPSSNANRVASPGSILQEMSRSGYVPGYPAPGSFPGFPGRSWQDIPPFLLRSFMPPGLPIGMDMLSTALLHSLQGSSMYQPSPTSLPMMRSPMGLIQPPFNAPLFSGGAETLRSSPIQKPHLGTPKPDSGSSVGPKQRGSSGKRVPSETNIYGQCLEQMMPSQKGKDYSPLAYNSPRTKSNKSVEESMVIPVDDDLDVVKIPDDDEEDNAPLALVTKKKPQQDFGEKSMQDQSCRGERSSVLVAPQTVDDQRKSTEETGASSAPIQVDERPPSKPDIPGDQAPAEPDVPEQRAPTVEVDQSAVSSKHPIALPPRKRLTRNTEDLTETPSSSSSSVAFSMTPSVVGAIPAPVTSSAVVLPGPSTPSSDSPQSSNFRSCWKKFSAKMTNHCQPVHRSYHAAGKPMYDCRAFFQKMSGKDLGKPGALMGKPYLAGNHRFYHRARYTGPRKEQQAQQEGSSSPRITRSQARQKKVGAEESGTAPAVAATTTTTAPAETPEVAPVRKSLRKKTSNSRYDAPDIVTPGAKTRRPRNSKKGQEDPRGGSVEGPNEGTEKAFEETQLEQTTKSGNDDEPPSDRERPAQAEDPPQPEESKAENRRLDSCDRKSTSSGLSTCSGDVSFDPEFPVSLPPKFRHTKRKSNFANSCLPEERTGEPGPALLDVPVAASGPRVETPLPAGNQEVPVPRLGPVVEATLVERAGEESGGRGDEVVESVANESKDDEPSAQAADDGKQAVRSGKPPDHSRPPTKITLKFESDTISTVISAASSGPFGQARADPPRKPQEAVPEFRLKIDLTELNKKSDEQVKRAVVALLPEAPCRLARGTPDPVDPLPTSKSNEVVGTRKVEIPGSSKPKTISVLLRSRGDALEPGQPGDAATPPDDNNDSTLVRTPRSEKRRKKGKGTKQKRQRQRKQSVAEEGGAGGGGGTLPKGGDVEDSNSSTAPVILPSNASCSSLVGTQSSDSPPLLEMTGQPAAYADQFSDISDSEAGRAQTVAESAHGHSSSSNSSRHSRSASQRAGPLTKALRKKRKSSAGSSADARAPPGGDPFEPFPVQGCPSSSSIAPEGKSVDVYEWSASECDAGGLDDIIKIRQNRLASRLMGSTGQAPGSSTSTPLKKRFLPSDNRPEQNFDSLLSTCKSVSVVVQKLDKEGGSGGGVGPDPCENDTPMSSHHQGVGNAALPQTAGPNLKVDGSKKRKKKTKQSKQDGKKAKLSEMPPEGDFVVIDDHPPVVDQRSTGRHHPNLLQAPGTLLDRGLSAPFLLPARLQPDLAEIVVPPRETRIPASIRLPRPVISQVPGIQPQDPEGKSASAQNAKAGTPKGPRADQPSSVPVKFKLKKIGRQWISVNDKEASRTEDATEAPKREKEARERKKNQKDEQPKKPARIASIFVPDSFAHGFVCHDELLQQAFAEKVLISEFLKGFDKSSSVADFAPDVSFKFVFDEDAEECEVSLMVDTRQAFFVPTELETLMGSLSLNDDDSVDPNKRAGMVEEKAVFAHQVTTAEEARRLLVLGDPAGRPAKTDEDGKTVLRSVDGPTTAAAAVAVVDYKKKDELLSALQDSAEEAAADLGEFDAASKGSKNPPFVPLFDDEMAVCTLDSPDDPWDVSGYQMINVMT